MKDLADLNIEIQVIGEHRMSQAAFNRRDGRFLVMQPIVSATKLPADLSNFPRQSPYRLALVFDPVVPNEKRPDPDAM